MKEIRIIIEQSNDGFYWAFAEGNEPITGGGATISECKTDVINCIETLKMFDENNKPAFLASPFELYFVIEN